MNSNFKVALELLNRYSVRAFLFISFSFFSPSCDQFNFLHTNLVSSISTDTPLRWYPLVTTCPRANRLHSERRCCPILPAIRVDQARTHECCFRVDRRGGRMACRQPDTSGRDPRAGGQSEQGPWLDITMAAPWADFCYTIIKQILHAKKTNYRDELFARTIKAGSEMQSANRKILLRMRLSVPNSLLVYIFLPLSTSANSRLLLCGSQTTSRPHCQSTQRFQPPEQRRGGDSPRGIFYDGGMMRFNTDGNSVDLFLHVLHLIALKCSRFAVCTSFQW